MRPASQSFKSLSIKSWVSQSFPTNYILLVIRAQNERALWNRHKKTCLRSFEWRLPGNNQHLHSISAASLKTHATDTPDDINICGHRSVKSQPFCLFRINQWKMVYWSIMSIIRNFTSAFWMGDILQQRTATHLAARFRSAVPCSEMVWLRLAPSMIKAYWLLGSRDMLEHKDTFLLSCRCMVLHVDFASISHILGFLLFVVKKDSVWRVTTSTWQPSHTHIS